MDIGNELHKMLFREQHHQLDLMVRTNSLPPKVRLALLKEAAPDLFNKLVTQSDFQQVLTIYTDAQRKTDTEYAWQLYYSNNTYKGVIDRVLDYGLGKSVNVVSATSPDVVVEALKAVRNRSVFGVQGFRQMGLSFLNESELLFILWYDLTTKLVTVQRLSTRDLGIIWADEETKTTPLVYTVNTTDGVIAYKDWRASDERVQEYLSANEDVILADDMESNLEGMSHVAMWSVGTNRHVTNGRGMPTYMTVARNVEYLSQFNDQRFAVSAEGAKYTTDYTVSGNNNDLETFINRESTYAPYGSGFVGNDNVNRDWNNNPTGANAERFNQDIFIQGISAATSLNGAQLGKPSMLSNRSTIEVLHETFIEAIEAFQNIISSLIDDMFNIIVIVSTNPQVIGTPDLFLEDSTELTVNLDTPLNIDVTKATEFIKLQRSREDLTPEEKEKLQTLETLVYDKFGVKPNVKSVTSSDKPTGGKEQNDKETNDSDTP